MRAFWWSYVPRQARHLSPVAPRALTDGAYLVAWPSIASVAPLVALVLGLALGWHRPESWTAPTESILVMVLLVIVAGFGAALGAYLTFGYAIGDFILRAHPAGGHRWYGLYALTHVRAPLLIAYVLVAALAVLVPLGSHQLSAPGALGIRRPTPQSPRVQRIAHAVIIGLFTAAWMLTAPILVRPLFTWQGHEPPPVVLPKIAWVLPFIAAVVALTRDHLESMAATDGAYAQFQADARRTRRAVPPRTKRILPTELSIVLGAACGTFLLSGLLRSPTDAVLLASVLILVAILGGVFGRAKAWTTSLSRVPVVPRLAVAAVLGAVAARAVIAALQHESPAFLAMAVALGASLSISAAMLADRNSPKPVPLATPPTRSPSASRTASPSRPRRYAPILFAALVLHAPALHAAPLQAGVCRNSFNHCVDELTDCGDLVDCLLLALEAALFAAALAALLALAWEVLIPAAALSAAEAAAAAAAAAEEAAAAAEAAAGSAVWADTPAAAAAAAEASEAASAAAAAADAAAAAAAEGDAAAATAAAAEAEAASAAAAEAAEAVEAEVTDSSALRTVLSGHGSFPAENGYFVCPEGTNITMFTQDMQILDDSVGQLVDQGLYPGSSVQTYGPGDLVPDYVLHPASDLPIQGGQNLIQPGVGPIMGQSNIVATSTNLSQLIGANQGEVWWSACRVWGL
jgi:hypothetical protein